MTTFAKKKNMKKKRGLVRIDVRENLKKLDIYLQQGGYTRYELMQKLDVGLTTIKTYLKWVKDGDFWSDYSAKTYSKYLEDDISILDTSERTIREDPERAYTEKNSKRANTITYKYAVKGFSMFEEKLTEDIIQTLLPFIEHIDQIYGLDDILEPISNAILDLIESQDKNKWKNKISNIKSGTNTAIMISLQQTTGLTESFNNAYMSILRNAIIEKKVVLVKYKPFKQPVSTLICHPYLIVESSSRWKLICKIEDVKEQDSSFYVNERLGIINVLSLEKMEDEIQILEDKEYQNDGKNLIIKNLERAAGPSISNWENPQRMNIKLKLSDNLTDYFKTKPFLTKGQNINGNIFSYNDAIYTIELRSKILRYGSAIEVLEPKELREDIIAEEIKNMHEIYYSESCVECSNEDHDSDATHCKFCGSRLDI